MFKRRLIFMLVGVALLGVSIALLRTAAFGIDPYTGMNMALSELFGFSLGSFQLGVNLVLLVPMLVWGRGKIGLGTLVNMTLVGYIVDFVRGLISNWEPGLAARVGVFAFGLLLMCFACAMYMGADMGVSPYDAQAILLAQYTKFSFRVLRIGTDCLCVAVALAALIVGGNSVSALVGAGTVITALGTGPLVQLFNDRLIRPWLGKLERSENPRVE